RSVRLPTHAAYFLIGVVTHFGPVILVLQRHLRREPAMLFVQEGREADSDGQGDRDRGTGPAGTGGGVAGWPRCAARADCRPLRPRRGAGPGAPVPGGTAQSGGAQERLAAGRGAGGEWAAGGAAPAQPGALGRRRGAR